MKLFRYIKGAAKFLLPVLAETALGKFRKKNPKYGWLVDAVEGHLAHIEADELSAAAMPSTKVEMVAQRVVNEFPDTDLDRAREIARLAIKHRQAK